jgi:hypothetical protein
MDRVLRAILRTDLSFFIRKVFTTISPGETYPHNWHVDAIAYQLMRVTANQTGCDAGLDNLFEHAAKNLSLTEAFVAGARKRRMIRDSVLDAKLAEPAIGEVHLNFTADQPFRADRKDIPHDQHPDHQLRIDRRATHRRIMRCKLAAKSG